VGGGGGRGGAQPAQTRRKLVSKVALCGALAMQLGNSYPNRRRETNINQLRKQLLTQQRGASRQRAAL
jgi:hypothetical protein